MEMSDAVKTDRRREAGERTRQRLLEAARTLLAERGEDALRLRDITEAAEANVAAVNYHFGSKDALCQEAVKQAISRQLDDQAKALGELSENASIEEFAAAWARPVVAAMTGAPCEERAFLRIMARATNDPSPTLREWMDAELARVEPDFLAPLRRALPGVPDDELRFRLESAGSILHFLSTGNMRLDVQDKSEDELTRMFTPVIAGALAGGANGR
jgi:AcrR family transcriptional regulator